MSNQNLSEIKTHFTELAAKWPSTLVSRDQIGNFTGGLISQGRMANLDCLGEGPQQRLRIGRKIAYPVKNLIVWLSERAEIVEKKAGAKK